MLTEEPVEISAQVKELHLPGRFLASEEPAEIGSSPRVGSDRFPCIIEPSRVPYPDKHDRNEHQDNYQQRDEPEIPQHIGHGQKRDHPPEQEDKV